MTYDFFSELCDDWAVCAGSFELMNPAGGIEI